MPETAIDPVAEVGPELMLWFDDQGKCDRCGKTKDRVIRRINHRPATHQCDTCFNGET